MTKMLQRLCWNSNGWRGPTGERFQKEDSYVGIKGFGHEEWNLNTADVVNGHVYGYTYYNPPSNEMSLGPHDIYFFAITPKKQRVLVGAHRGAFFLTEPERSALKERLRGSDYLERRAHEILALGLPHFRREEDALEVLLNDFSHNVRTEPQNVLALPHQVLNSENVGGKNPLRLNRYTKPVFLENSPYVGSAADRIAGRSAEGKDILIEDAYVRFTEAQRRVILRRHNLLSNRFRVWLKTVGATAIRVEVNSIDVSCVCTERSSLFELKTSYRLPTRHALREALGQVLEYAFFPGRGRPECLAVVLDTEPTASDVVWFRSLAKAGVPIELFWMVGEAIYSARAADHPLACLALPSGVGYEIRSQERPAR